MSIGRRAGSAGHSRSIDRAARGAILTYAVVMLVIVSRSWYRDDDFIYIWQTTHGDGLLHAMFTPYVGHLLPGDFFATWLTQIPAEMGWWVNAVVIVAGLAVSAELVWRVFRSVIGPRLLSLALLIPYLTAGSILLTANWWAAAVEYVPMLIGLPATILLMQRALRTPKWTADLLPSLALVATVFFFEKALLDVVLVAALVAITPLTDSSPPSFLGRLRQAARPLGLLLATALAYGLLFITLTAGQPRGLLANSELLRDLSPRPAINTLLPSLVGLPPLLAELKDTVFGTFVRSIALMTLGALVIRSAHRMRNWYLPWLVLAVVVTLNIALLVAARRPAEGSPRYWSDLVFPMLLLVGLSQDGSVFDRGHRRESTTRRASAVGESQHRPWRLAALAGFTTVATISLFFTASRAPSAPAHRYVDNALASASRLGEPLTLLVERVPNEVMLSFLLGENTTRTVLEPSSGRFVFAPTTTHPLTVLGTGEIVPARLTPFLRADGPPDDGGCIATLDSVMPRSLVLSGALSIHTGFGELDYTAPQDTHVVLRWGEGSIDLPLEAGRGAVFFSAPRGERRTVELSADPSSTCIRGLSIGELAPE